jgi:[CysO sulfur-carrier protein]-S-L-cysteine hydrolase
MRSDIDATANPDILNLVSAVCAVTSKPALWAEVFGGGIGGLIARCRPNLEPSPQYMRRAIVDFKRFNYIGEWHSHPAFEAVPSGEDVASMFEIIEDPAVGVNFAILIIARQESGSVLQLSATLFRAGIIPEPIEVIIDDRVEDSNKENLLTRILSFFRALT